MRTEQLYLLDILGAADSISEFVSGVEESDFFADEKTQSAVLQKLIVIGEAAARLPQEFKTRHAEIEWRDIVAFRNILVHSYFSLKFDIVWETTQTDIPKLRQSITKILEEEFNS